jgi:hypothetical protein
LLGCISSLWTSASQTSFEQGQGVSSSTNYQPVTCRCF